MKTAAEVFKCVLSDEGFKVFAAKCGHKEDVSQWQDIHNILLASYEVLLKSAIQEFRTAVRGEKQEDFWTWIKELSSSNDDEIQAFWSRMLIYLNAYVGFFFANPLRKLALT